MLTSKVSTTPGEKLPVYNFGAGPAMLPRPVMEIARDELLDWHGTGISVMEMSHRSKEFTEIAHDSEVNLRSILNIPENYRVLFLQGGATHLMSMVPLNLLGNGETGDYLHTGSWSGKAIKEAARLANINVTASSENDNFYTIPARETWKLSTKPAYLYYCDNETIAGVEFPREPDTGGILLASDMTSNFLSRSINIKKFAVIFAGAQKNFGPAGMTIVIIREDLIGRAREKIPFLYDFKLQAENNSMYNTPPTFNWYIAGLVFDWVISNGGVEQMHINSKKRSAKLYQAIDENDFYHNPVKPEFRSRMNVPFLLKQDTLNEDFLTQARENGLYELKGHRSVGGMRASIYNGMPEAGVDALIEFMQEFARTMG